MTERYLIPSVVHACEVFRLLASRDRGMTMQELEAALDLPRTTVFRLLRTLVAEEMLEKRGKIYFCGANLMQLGLQIIHSDRNVSKSMCFDIATLDFVLFMIWIHD